VLAGVLWVPATYTTAGEVISAGAPAAAVIWLGAYPEGSHPRLAAIAGDLRAADFEVQVVPDIIRWKAAKLLGSVTFALTALYRPGKLRDQAAGLLRAEAREILTAAGYGIADVDAESTADLTRLAARPVAGRAPDGNSTWQSFSRSSPLETDFLNGEIVLAARLLGRTAPASQAVAERARQAWRDGVAPGSLGPDDLLAVLPQLRPAGSARR
jgi:ketopantoate reductase